MTGKEFLENFAKREVATKDELFDMIHQLVSDSNFEIGTIIPIIFNNAIVKLTVLEDRQVEVDIIEVSNPSSLPCTIDFSSFNEDVADSSNPDDNVVDFPTENVEDGFPEIGKDEAEEMICSLLNEMEAEEGDTSYFAFDNGVIRAEVEKDGMVALEFNEVEQVLMPFRIDVDTLD